LLQQLLEREWHLDLLIFFLYTCAADSLFDVELPTYGLKAQVGIIGGVLPGFVTGIHKDSVSRWNLWFPSAGVFAEVLAGRATLLR